jgi:hypothetical protein
MTEYLFIGLAYVAGTFVSYMLFRPYVIGQTISSLIQYGVIRSKTDEDGSIEILKYDGTEIK